MVVHQVGMVLLLNKKYASEIDIVSFLCNMFTICFRFGVVPCSFVNGILSPLLKKPSLDASVAIKLQTCNFVNHIF